jgi:hypothetical protein
VLSILTGNPEYAKYVDRETSEVTVVYEGFSGGDFCNMLLLNMLVLFAKSVS